MVEKQIPSSMLLAYIPWLLVGLMVIACWLAWGNFEYFVRYKLGWRRFS